jgi:hypothetical protein
MTYHFSGLNFICHVFSQFSTFSKSFCNNSESLIIHISFLSKKNGRVWDGGFICLYLYYKIPCSNCHHELIKCLRCKPRNSPGTFFGPIADVDLLPDYTSFYPCNTTACTDSYNTKLLNYILKLHANMCSPQ